MSAHRPEKPDPLDGQNFSHSSGSPMARLPDPVPQEADHTRESFRAKITGAAVSLVILLAIIAWLIFS